jgi:hypothetical protein
MRQWLEIPTTGGVLQFVAEAQFAKKRRLPTCTLNPSPHSHSICLETLLPSPYFRFFAV